MRVTEQGNTRDIRVAYRQPTLVRYGAVRDTASGTGSMSEGGTQPNCSSSSMSKIKC